MFGLQAPIYEDDLAYQRHRLHYCASCKSIATAYGHSSRLLLNYDLVFLAELLTALSNEDLQAWEPNLRAVHQCFRLPKDQTESSILEYIAALHLFLAELKIQDQIEDGGRSYWRWLRSFYRPNFQKAARDLEAWGLDTAKCFRLAASQLEQETTEIFDFENLESYLAYVATPTAKITQEVLSAAANRLNLDVGNLKKVAYAFGELTYLIDAYEDWEKDLKKGDFNPFIRWGATKDMAWSLLVQQKEVVEVALLELNLSKELLVSFCTRLSSNLFKKEKKQLSLSRWELAKAKASNTLCQPNTLQQQFKYNILAWAFFIQPEGGFRSWGLIGGLMMLLGYSAYRKLPIPQRINPCRKKKEDCRRAVIGIFIALILMALIVLGFMIWGVVLLLKGAMVWGLVLLLFFPLMLGLFFLIRAIRRARMTKKERRRADRKARWKRRILKFLYKRSIK